MEPDYIDFTFNPHQSFRLPLPEPTEEAVEAGIFGICADGTKRPNRQEVRNIVNNQLMGMTNLKIKIETYSRAEVTGRHPITGHWSNSTLRQAQNREAAAKLAQDARVAFLGHANAYSRAFGDEASRLLNRLADALAKQKIGPQDPLERQLELF